MSESFIGENRVASRAGPDREGEPSPKKGSPAPGDEHGASALSCGCWVGGTHALLAPPRNNLKLNSLMSQIRKTNPGGDRPGIQTSTGGS